MLRKRLKYGNRKVRFAGYLFDSQAEFERYKELLLLCEAGEIDSITVHPSYPLTINGKYVGNAEFDFQYYTDSKTGVGTITIEDVKGRDARTGRVVTDTELSRFKRRVFEALHGTTVMVVERAGKKGRGLRARSEKEWKR